MSVAIIKTPGVCGGSACIAGTRIPVWVVEVTKRQGRAPAHVTESYPHITHDQIRAAFKYAEDNKDEIDQDIRENST